MKYLMLMTLTGSLLYGGYLVWEKYFGDSLTQAMKYRALAVVLLSYAVPWVWLRRVYSSLVRMFLGKDVVAGGGVSVSIADIEAEGGAYMTTEYWHVILFVGMWLCGVAGFMLKRFVAHLRGKQALLAVMTEYNSPALKPIAVRLQKEFRYRHKLKIIEAQRNRTLTIGMIKPVIALQRYDTDKEMELILRHEMIHIVRKDVMWKILMEAVCCLHWFNPLVYRLKRRFDLMCETSCDERVLKSCSAEEREIYGRLIIKSMRKEEPDTMFSSAFGDDQKDAEARVELIIKPIGNKYKKKIAAAGMFAGLMVMSSMTAFAYPHAYHVEDTAAEVAKDSVSGTVYWSAEACGQSEGTLSGVVLYEEQFVDETGIIHPVNRNPRRTCRLEHEIVSGYYQMHLKDDNGGCTMKLYESTGCTKCNTIWVDDLINTGIRVKCTH